MSLIKTKKGEAAIECRMTVDKLDRVVTHYYGASDYPLPSPYSAVPAARTEEDSFATYHKGVQRICSDKTMQAMARY